MCPRPRAQQQRADDILIALLFPRALDAATIAAAGLIAPLDLVRRTSAVLTDTIQHTTAGTPAQLIQQLLARLDRLSTAHPTTAAPNPRSGATGR